MTVYSLLFANGKLGPATKPSVDMTVPNLRGHVARRRRIVAGANRVIRALVEIIQVVEKVVSSSPYPSPSRQVASSSGHDNEFAWIAGVRPVEDAGKILFFN